MLITNKYKISIPQALEATDDANATTGNQSDRWGGVNPNVATGATGNAATGDGLVYATSNATYDKQIISKLVSITIDEPLAVGEPNYIKIELSNLGIEGNFVVKGATIIGVYNPAATNTGVNPTPSLMQASGQVISIVKDALIFRIAAAEIDLYQDNVVNILLYYSNN